MGGKAEPESSPPGDIAASESRKIAEQQNSNQIILPADV